jgi:hypothetical protein
MIAFPFMKTSFSFPFSGVLLLGLLVGLASCGNDPLRDLSVEDSQTFITNYEPAAPFGTYRTFGIRDSVYVVDNGQTSASTTDRDLTVINRVVENLQQRGYVRADSGRQPDLVVDVARITESSVGVVSNPNFWGPGWGGGWGWGGGFYYPPAYSYYEVSESYWYAQIADLKNRGTASQPTVVWSAQIRGGSIFDAGQLTRLVDAVFAQSPYLKVN